MCWLARLYVKMLSLFNSLDNQLDAVLHANCAEGIQGQLFVIIPRAEGR